MTVQLLLPRLAQDVSIPHDDHRREHALKVECALTAQQYQSIHASTYPSQHTASQP